MTTNLTDRARKLRKDSTEAERLLWRHLKAKQILGLKFRRQEQIGYYIVDFVCYKASLIVEADGGQHLENAENDEDRTKWLNSQGFMLLRFWNNEILTNIDGVLENILKECQRPLSPALSHKERGS
jgi:very-short-patch-repair endonuclease